MSIEMIDHVTVLDTSSKLLILNDLIESSELSENLRNEIFRIGKKNRLRNTILKTSKSLTISFNHVKNIFEISQTKKDDDKSFIVGKIYRDFKLVDNMQLGYFSPVPELKKGIGSVITNTEYKNMWRNLDIGDNKYLIYFTWDDNESERIDALLKTIKTTFLIGNDLRGHLDRQLDDILYSGFKSLSPRVDELKGHVKDIVHKTNI